MMIFDINKNKSDFTNVQLNNSTEVIISKELLENTDNNSHIHL